MFWAVDTIYVIEDLGVGVQQVNSKNKIVLANSCLYCLPECTTCVKCVKCK